ncbi:MAG: tetratricopeptide repeat protein [Pyrinomonadaceae bacterium]|nr:tetratricopeptide repeat protein [Pyrinomonadaceae bacterium]
MKRTIFLSCIIVLASLSALAQSFDIKKPTLTPKSITDSQTETIRAGIALHDAKKYDEAIEKYETVLKESPDSTLALYELALTYYAKGEKYKAAETSLRGSQYKSQELPLFYATIANVIDDAGKPKDAIKLYRDALKILKNDPLLQHHIPSVHYNLGVTYTRQKMYAEAKAELKRAVELEHTYPSPHYLLAEIFIGTKYKVPAMMAAARLISLEHNSGRTSRAVAIYNSVMAAAKKDEKTGNTTINLDFFAPEDEGKFAMYDLLIPTLGIIDEEKNKDKEPKTAEEMVADNLDSLIAMLSEDKELKKTFVGKQYIPFLAEMKELGYSRAFAYLVMYRSGNQNAAKWLETNSLKIEQFLNWAKTYKPAAK